MHVYQPSHYTPRSMRGNTRGAPKDPMKKRSFAQAARWSKRFIGIKASQLAKPKMAAQYEEWLIASRKGSLRKTVGGSTK